MLLDVTCGATIYCTDPPSRESAQKQAICKFMLSLLEP